MDCNLQSFTISAPGKIILFGEHSVVYGKKALACSINKRVEISITKTNDGLLRLHFADLWDNELCIKTDELKYDKTNLQAYCEEFSSKCCLNFENILSKVALSCFLYGYLLTLKDLPSMSAKITSTLPLGAGLGSSASFNTTLACAFLILNGDILKGKKLNRNITFTSEDAIKINDLSFKLEKIVHEKPSGIDNTISVNGGAIAFQNSKMCEFNMPKLNLLVVDTKVSRNTKSLVCGVREKYNLFPSLFTAVFESMDQLANDSEILLKSLTETLSEEKLNHLELLMNTNQGLLSAIGVSHPSIDTIISICKRHSVACKLTGAGGGGCVIALLNPFKKDSHNELKKELESNNCDVFEVQLGCEGLKIL